MRGLRFCTYVQYQVLSAATVQVVDAHFSGCPLFFVICQGMWRGKKEYYCTCGVVVLVEESKLEAVAYRYEALLHTRL